MITTLVELELRLLDKLSRDQLLAMLAVLGHCLPLEFTREWQEQQPTEQLRILVLAARIISVMRPRAHSDPVAP